MDDITYDVRLYKTEVYKGTKVTTYYVRWKVGGKGWREPFRHSGQAESFRSKLHSAAKDGEAYRMSTGRPVSWDRDAPKESVTKPITWYQLTLDYSAIKWKFASPNQRRSIAEALTDATEVLFTSESPYTRAEVRWALQTWAYSARLRGESEPPEDITPIVKWIADNTIPVAALADPETSGIHSRAILDRISSKQDGTLAAANTANRKRTVLNNLMTYMELERKLITGNPLKAITWNSPRKLKTVDPRCVINSDQARRFLDAVASNSDRGKRLKAFFGCMYYAALRPEEVADLREPNIASLPDNDLEWGEFTLTNSQPRSGSNWTDDGSVRQRRELKHRAKEETRTVPIHPELVKLLREHLDEFGTGPNGRIFTLATGKIVTDRAYLKVFHDARSEAFTETEAASLIARRPYDLRHAAVSTWLNAGVEPAQVAKWAGHTTDVLLRVYANCVAGQQDEAKRRIIEATKPSDDQPHGRRVPSRPGDSEPETEMPDEGDGEPEP
jgi:integrase